MVRLQANNRMQAVSCLGVTCCGTRVRSAFPFPEGGGAAAAWRRGATVRRNLWCPIVPYRSLLALLFFTLTLTPCLSAVPCEPEPEQAPPGSRVVPSVALLPAARCAVAAAAGLAFSDLT